MAARPAGRGTKAVVRPLETPDSGTSALQVPTSGVTLLHMGQDVEGETQAERELDQSCR